MVRMRGGCWNAKLPRECTWSFRFRANYTQVKVRFVFRCCFCGASGSLDDLAKENTAAGACRKFYREPCSVGRICVAGFPDHACEGAHAKRD